MNVKTEHAGNACVLQIEGDIGVENSPQLRSALSALTNDKIHKIALDLAGVNYMDSSGIATLVEGLKRVSRYGGQFRLFNVNRVIKDVLDITRLSNLFDIRKSREDALA